ncbi:MAG: hypothetical protein HY514_00170 [Candidatus Aenigmarchaeota archaeon]|nr:hypothetical protein [Candidatus Aenigmarchaeota archaeon]
MKAFIARTPVGIFAFYEDGTLISYKLADSVQEGLGFIKNPVNPLESDLSGYEITENDLSYQILRRNFRNIWNNIIGKSGKELQIFLNEFGIKYSMSFLSSAVSRDKLIIQAASALADLTKITNIYTERLWEWFSLHYPEAKRTEIVENVAKHGNRKNFPDFVSSFGIDLKEEDEKILKTYAIMIKSTLEQKKLLEKYLIAATKEIMPNFSSLIDSLLAVRFLALAGSLERLARMPASTLQLLGAEKALFRHLKHQGKSPKFGIIFQDGRIQSAPEQKRGKVARVIASKLMQAARIDFYSGRSEEKLRADLDKELKNI